MSIIRDIFSPITAKNDGENTFEIAGPEPIRQDDLVRQFLSASGNARTVIIDPKALHFGITVNDQSLTPGDNPRIGPTRAADWVARSRE